MTATELSIEEVWNQYKKHRYKTSGIKEISLSLEFDFLKPFLRYLRENRLPHGAVGGLFMKEYKKWLWEFRDKTRCYLKPIWFRNHYRFLKIYFKWLLESKHIPEDPLASCSLKEMCEESENHIRERTRRNLESRPQGLSDENLFSVYLGRLEQYKNPKGLRRAELGINCLKEFLARQSKTVLTLGEEDFQVLREFCFEIDTRPHVTGIIASYMNFIAPVRTFYRWLKDEGYLEKNILEKFRIYELEEYIGKRREEETEKKRELMQRRKECCFEEIVAEYREKRLKTPFIKKDSHSLHFRSLEYFLMFFRKGKYNLSGMNGDLLETYKQWLYMNRNEEGFRFSASSIVYCLQTLGTFLSWLRENFYIPENPLSGFNLSQYRRAIEERLENRRKKLLSLRGNRFDDEKMFKSFLEEFLMKENPLSLKRYNSAFRYFREYLTKRGRTLSSLCSGDLKSLLDYYAERERYACLTGNVSSVRYCFVPVHVLYRWLYEEGFLEVNPLDVKEVLEFIEKHHHEKIRRSGGGRSSAGGVVTPFKGRYYTVKEILKSFRKYLEKVCRFQPVALYYYTTVREFLRFLITRQKTVYTFSGEVVEEYKKFLFSYEYMPGRYFTARSQTDRLQKIKRFYDWLLFNGMVKEHPLRDFSPGEYFKEIKDFRKKEARPTLDNLIPARFREIYKGAWNYGNTLNLSPGTIYSHRNGWKFFFGYVEKIGLKSLRSLDEKIIAEYHIYLTEYRDSLGKKMSINSRIRLLAALKRLLRYLARFKYLRHDLSGTIVFPKGGQGLPTAGISEKDAVKIIEIKDGKSRHFLRSRAILEFLYSTGVRANELCNVKLSELYFDEGMVRINVPKGGIRFQRKIPIGETACYWVKKYMEEYRSRFAKPDNEYLFIGTHGKKISRDSVLNVVKSAVMQAGVTGKRLVTHSFRVACATGMLRGKASIKHVQEQLGHVSIQSTSKYLRLVPDDLKKAHSRSHPRERKVTGEGNPEEATKV